MQYHLSTVYEKVAVETLMRHMQRFFPYTSLGRWWDKNEEIDVVGINRESNSILFCEVKWTDRPAGTDIYEALKLKSERVQWGKRGRQEYFCLFSKKGFTAALLKRAKEEGAVLFKEDMPLSDSY